MRILNEARLKTIWRVEGGLLDGTELELILAFISVKYPHRKTKDLYVPPFEIGDKKSTTIHCCQDKCSNPDFEPKDLLKHLELHAGKLLKKRLSA